jgi:predicted CXXCH cytochrome family protein
MYSYKFYKLIFCCLCITLIWPVLLSAGVYNTKHNLSVSGPGVVTAVSETQICIFCHTPHNAYPVAPLWNHELSAVENYSNYWSPTLKSYASESEAPPIDGFSKLCLSCHDGTVAIGSVSSREKPIETTTDFIDVGLPGYLGTDLSGGHPISIVFDIALVNLRNEDSSLMHLNWPINDPDIKLYPTQGQYGIQCTSCHDPHGGKGGPGAPPFWKKNTYDDVCLVCHDIVSEIGH